MEEREEKIKGIMGHIKTLPMEAKRAACWLIENIDFVEEMIMGDKIPQSVMEQYIENAYGRKDYSMLLLMLYMQSKDRIEEGKEI